MMHTILLINKWLETTAISHAMAGRLPWSWPLCETLHFLGLAMLIGCIGVIDLRMLGFARHVSIHSLHQFVPWGVAGFTLNLITGALFYIGAPSQYVNNFAFLMKLIFIGIAGLNILYFYLGGVMKRVDALGPEDAIPLDARMVSLVSIVSWFMVMYWGRMLPFVGNAF
jgi:hypothetical protein